MKQKLIITLSVLLFSTPLLAEIYEGRSGFKTSKAEDGGTIWIHGEASQAIYEKLAVEPIISPSNPRVLIKAGKDIECVNNKFQQYSCNIKIDQLGAVRNEPSEFGD